MPEYLPHIDYSTLANRPNPWATLAQTLGSGLMDVGMLKYRQRLGQVNVPGSQPGAGGGAGGAAAAPAFNPSAWAAQGTDLQQIAPLWQGAGEW